MSHEQTILLSALVVSVFMAHQNKWRFLFLSDSASVHDVATSLLEAFTHSESPHSSSKNGGMAVCLMVRDNEITSSCYHQNGSVQCTVSRILYSFLPTPSHAWEYEETMIELHALPQVDHEGADHYWYLRPLTESRANNHVKEEQRQSPCLFILNNGLTLPWVQERWKI
jgi:hypothetical protein